MNMELEGKVAIVTGAAGGFGRELVRGLLDAGAKVAALDVDEKRLDELAAMHEESVGTGRLVTARTDISRCDECEAAVAEARARASEDCTSSSTTVRWGWGSSASTT